MNEILKVLTNDMEMLARVTMETSNGVTIFDSDTGNTLWVNEGFSRYTGYSLEDLKGKDQWSILTGPETDSFTLDYIKSQIRSNLPYCCDVLIYAKSGQAKWQYLNGQQMRGEVSGIGKYFSVSTDISGRLRMEEERISEKVERQKELTRIILQAQEIERNKLGRELHDNLNQMLASVNLQLGYYLEQPENNSEIVENCRRILQKIIQDARNISHHMVMPHFTDRSLKEELELLVENYSYKKIVQVDLLNMHEKDIPNAIKDTIYRIAQMQLSNIQKHARARKISLQIKTEDQLLTMVILDNGIGFDLLQRREGHGIPNIFSRVESYNGTVNIDSQPGKGCTLCVTIPLPNNDGN